MQVIFQWYWECPHPCPYRSIGATFVKILKLFIGWSKKCLGGSWKVPGVPRTLGRPWWRQNCLYRALFFHAEIPGDQFWFQPGKGVFNRQKLFSTGRISGEVAFNFGKVVSNLVKWFSTLEKWFSNLVKWFSTLEKWFSNW